MHLRDRNVFNTARFFITPGFGADLLGAVNVANKANVSEQVSVAPDYKEKCNMIVCSLTLQDVDWYPCLFLGKYMVNPPAQRWVYATLHLC